MVLPHGAMGLSAVCDCISLSYSLTILRGKTITKMAIRCVKLTNRPITNKLQRCITEIVTPGPAVYGTRSCAGGAISPGIFNHQNNNHAYPDYKGPRFSINMYLVIDHVVQF